MEIQTLVALATIMSAFAAVAALVVSVIVYRGQSALSAAIADKHGQLSDRIAKDQGAISLKIHENETRLSQRQLLLPLWQYISTLDQINAQKPITPDILKVVNTLELVALTCEGGMVDAQVIKRTFSELYLKLYDQVDSVAMVPGMNLSGHDLLRQNPAAMAFYDELKREHMNRGKLTP